MRSPADLAEWIADARARTFALVEDLEDEQLFGPRLKIVNPLHWEIGHVAWFTEKWVLRHALGRAPIRADGDSLYDSSAIPHDVRWDLPLPSRADTIAYLAETRDRVLDVLRREPFVEALHYFTTLVVYHEDMHDEAFLYTRQTHGWRAPRLIARRQPPAGPLPGDVAIPGGAFRIGPLPDDEPFVFDNEKWGHTRDVAPFRIARAPVTQAEFAAFVDDGGYARRELWSPDGWSWRADKRAEHPFHWRRDGADWSRRRFDEWVPLEPDYPVIHVNWWEADAYCRWAGRRLPTELEWEVAAAGEPDGDRLSPRKRRFPWGDDAPTPERANLDARAMGCVDVAAHAGGDSAFGCRQMIGNVWEWCADDFAPYPGFVADPYEDYSRPWFHTHKVLRGGCWVTRGRLLRNTWRNFYTPDRRDVWAGFRTCASD